MTNSNSATEETVLLSMLEHYSYCPRQCALIHREQIYDENVYTLKGKEVHERVDEPGSASVSGVRTEYGMPLWSETLGLIGKADAVEFYGDAPYPVEYKHGPARYGAHADLQLCGQAMCLEEMLQIETPAGAVYHYSSRTRREVRFTAELRARTETAIVAIRNMLLSETLPPVLADSRCRNCSLVESCLPFVIANREIQKEYDLNLFKPAQQRGRTYGS